MPPTIHIYACICAAVKRSPRRSIRKHAAALTLSKSTVHTILQKDLNFHLYKIQITQTIKVGDYPVRVAFAQNMLRNFDNFDNIQFSDEAHFHLNGSVNKQNCRYWSDNNPREKHQQPLHSPKVSVWAAKSAHGIIGPFFLKIEINALPRLTLIVIGQCWKIFLNQNCKILVASTKTLGFSKMRWLLTLRILPCRSFEGCFQERSYKKMAISIILPKVSI